CLHVHVAEVPRAGAGRLRLAARVRRIRGRRSRLDRACRARDHLGYRGGSAVDPRLPLAAGAAALSAWARGAGGGGPRAARPARAVGNCRSRFRRRWGIGVCEVGTGGGEADPRGTGKRPAGARLKPRLGSYRWSGRADVSLLTRAEPRVHSRTTCGAALRPSSPRSPPSALTPDRSAGTAPRRRTARGPTPPRDRRSSGTTAAAQRLRRRAARAPQAVGPHRGTPAAAARTA